MEMTLRWYGSKFDTVTLEQIRQIPGVKGVITTLYDIPAGEEWPMERILQMKKSLNTILAERTGQPYEVICKDTERDNFMTAQEAVEYGLIDKVFDKH